MHKTYCCRKNRGSAFIFFILMTAVAAITAAGILSFSIHSSVITEKGIASVTTFYTADLAYNIYQKYIQDGEAEGGLTETEKEAFRTKIQTEFFGAGGEIAELQFCDVAFSDTEVVAGLTATAPSTPNDFWSFRSSKNLVVGSTIR